MSPELGPAAAFTSPNTLVSLVMMAGIWVFRSIPGRFCRLCVWVYRENLVESKPSNVSALAAYAEVLSFWAMHLTLVYTICCVSLRQ